MTRFARAKGSKASNERVPDEATPWHVMKDQLEDKMTMKRHQAPKIKTAKELLSEKELYYHDTTGNVNNEWAEFETSGGEKRSKLKNKDTSDTGIKKKSKNNKSMELENVEAKKKSISKNEDKDGAKIKKKSKNKSMEFENVEAKKKSISKNEDEDGAKIKKKSKNNKSMEFENVEVKEKSISKNQDQYETKMKKKSMNNESIEFEKQQKKSKKRAKSGDDESIESHRTKLQEFTSETKDDASRVVKNKTKSKKKLKHKEKKMFPVKDSRESKCAEIQPEEKSEENEQGGKAESNGLKISKRHKRNQKRLRKNANFDASGNERNGEARGVECENSSIVPANGNRQNLKNPSDRQNLKRKAKIRDDGVHKRRKPDVPSVKCTINGMDVEIVKYDGFPVKKEDAERLKELREKMIMKGIPKSEIDSAMKLERRRAEKALARVKKQVCFHCRKAGHNLSDCPELGQEESATGICFKCGSTEHTHFNCRVTKKEEFRFASCFICREQGHIAKQCPDNPKGLYPQGGSCKICGDVTHLKKDCPDLTREKEDNTLTLGTIVNDVESLDEPNVRKPGGNDDIDKPKSKIVKF